MLAILLVLISILSNDAFSYTLNNNFGAAFKDNEVRVKVAGDTTCALAGITAYELQDMVAPAIDKFWNRVPTSSLQLKTSGFTDIITNINTGRLCSPTDDECIDDAPGTVIPPVNDIVIACNNNATNFGGAGVLAVTIPNNFSGKQITGAVILINNSSTVFSTLSKADQIGVIAHEIGHAIGLGHTNDKAALMYYRTVDQRRALGEDDMRGVSYLYPMKFDGFGLLGGCGTLGRTKRTSHHFSSFWPMLAAMASLILIYELVRLFNRFKTRPSL